MRKAEYEMSLSKKNSTIPTRQPAWAIWNLSNDVDKSLRPNVRHKLAERSRRGGGGGSTAECSITQ